MSWRAWSYIWVVLLIAVAVIGSALDTPHLSTYQWLTFVVLTILATTTHSFEAILGRQSYYPHMSLFFARLLLLPLGLFIAVVTIPHCIEWVKKRSQDSQYLRKWYVQPFNIAVHLLSGAGTLGTFSFFEADNMLYLTPRNGLIIVGAAATYVLLNHLLIGLVLVVARGISWQQSRILALDFLSVEVAILLMGYVTAVLWSIKLALILLGFVGTLLVYQTLCVPLVKKYA